MARTFNLLVDKKTLTAQPRVFDTSAEATAHRDRIVKKTPNDNASNYTVVSVTV